MKKKENKKVWVKPEVKSLSVKKDTLGGAFPSNQESKYIFHS
jgi:hypothetical protein